MEFDSTVKSGVRAAQADVVVHLRRSDDRERGEGPRVGLIVGKSVGSAVDRHRVSRRLRHVVRPMLPDLRHGDQVVLRALPGSRTASSARLEQQVRNGLRRAAGQTRTDR